MIRKFVPGLVTRLVSWWAVGDSEERIEGTGEVYLDPAYNGRYAAERRLQDLSNEGGSDRPPRGDDPGR